jgi:hypothetical protein
MTSLMESANCSSKMDRTIMEPLPMVSPMVMGDTSSAKEVTMKVKLGIMLLKARERL